MESSNPLQTSLPVAVETSSAKPYIPLSSYQPAFANVAPADTAFPIPSDVMGILAAAETLSIRQHVKLLPKQCCVCPPCVKQENTYSVYAGLSRDDQNEFLRIDEVSHDWSRCCCTPYHPLKLEVRQFIPAPGASTAGSSDWDHMKGDACADMERMTKKDKSIRMKELAMERPVLFTMVRTDGQRCSLIDCKWLSTFVCFKCCQDGMELYAGPVVDGKEAGRLDPNASPPVELLMGSAIQPNFGGCCIPKMELRGEASREDQTPFGKIEGPCCFGGWSEMCFDFKFFASMWDSPDKKGDIALITKKKPFSGGAAMTELLSDSDNYSIEFNREANLTGAQKATVLGAQILADYMYFDGNTDKCRVANEGIYCYLCYCSIIGCIAPCYVFIPTKKS